MKLKEAIEQYQDIEDLLYDISEGGNTPDIMAEVKRTLKKYKSFLDDVLDNVEVKMVIQDADEEEEEPKEITGFKNNDC